MLRPRVGYHRHDRQADDRFRAAKHDPCLSGHPDEPVFVGPGAVLLVDAGARHAALHGCAWGIVASAHWFHVRAYSMQEVAAPQPLDFARLPIIALAAWFLFDEVAGSEVWLGAAVVFGSGIHISYCEAQLKARAGAQSGEVSRGYLLCIVQTPSQSSPWLAQLVVTDAFQVQLQAPYLQAIAVLLPVKSWSLVQPYSRNCFRPDCRKAYERLMSSDKRSDRWRHNSYSVTVFRFCL